MDDTHYYVPEGDIEKLISQGNRSNANMAHNPETIHKYVADQVMKQYALKKLPDDIRNAHNNGDLHIHDLEFMMDRSLNCLVHDLRVFLKHGLKVDGNGDHTSVAGPPRRLSTIMNHTGEIMLSAQQDMSGGQGMTLWNVFVAPYVNKSNKEELYECIQQLIFNLNMAYASRGGQVPFTTINLELGVPNFLMDVPAILPGGVMDGSTYGDYVDEAKLVTEVFTEVLYQGDYLGKPHLFPNTTYSLRPEYEGSEYDKIKYDIHNLSAKYGSSYFINMYPEYQGTHTDYMGCRTRLSSDWTGNWENDTLRTGNLAYVTLNLPRIALEMKEGTFMEILREKMELCQQYLLRRKIRAENLLWDYNLFPFISQEIESEQYYKIDNSTLSFGFCGMAEAVKIITGEDLHSSTAQAVALNILQEMRSIVDEYRVDGQRWSMIQTPAESTAYRFAKIDNQMYPHAIYNGTSKAPYYSNSCHLPVDSPASFTEKLKWEERTHPLTNGGHIFHAFMGESYSDPESLISLTNKIAKTNIGFWAYSSALSFCMKCNKMMKGLQSKCTHCGETREVEWYDRITGYVQQVGHAKHSHGGWNQGKQQELIDRRRY